MIAARHVAAALRADGWNESPGAIPQFRKRIAGRAQPGAFAPDGGRVVTLRLDVYQLERLGPWGELERSARLGAYGCPADAIADALMP